MGGVCFCDGQWRGKAGEIEQRMFSCCKNFETVLINRDECSVEKNCLVISYLGVFLVKLTHIRP